MNRPLVLVVEDDAPMRGVIALALRTHGCEVREAVSGASALEQVAKRTPDAMILDIGLPDMDGFVVTSHIRQNHEFPIIVLSARGEEQHQIRALDTGANDYVTKPFREGELMARVRVALRRPVPLRERRDLVVGDVRIEAVQRRVFVGGAEIALTRTEFDLLDVLARNADRVMTHRQLLSAVWGAEHADEVHYLRVYIRALRAKLERDPTRPRRLLTALGVGYRLAVRDVHRAP